jgi:hypothetical protein
MTEIQSAHVREAAQREAISAALARLIEES